MDQHEYNLNKVAPLVGATIKQIIQSDDDGNHYQAYGFRCVKDGQWFDVWIDMDEEGNGPGHLDVEKVEP